ncbi:MAG: tyrosine-type recombinase/integrase [Archaeoglobales archaeon]|nr:tyrosine-type recombinase/integrase [Archaeoglobales archaeon]
MPKIPKQLKTVIKIGDVQKILIQANALPHPYNLRLKAAILLTATSGLRAEEVYKLEREDFDLENRTIYLKAEKTKDFEERLVFFSEETKSALKQYFEVSDYVLFPKKSIAYWFKKIETPLRLKHMRKLSSQQSDRLGMPTAVKKLLMGHSLQGDVDLNHYDFQDEEELRKIYDKYWRGFRILS